MGVNGIKRGGTRWQKFRRYGGNWGDSFFETFFGHTFLLFKSFLSFLFLFLVLVTFLFYRWTAYAEIFFTIFSFLKWLLS